MSERWQDLEAIAERLRQAAEKLRDDQLKRDAAVIDDEAKHQRDIYVRWLWGR